MKSHGVCSVSGLILITAYIWTLSSWEKNEASHYIGEETEQ